MKYLSKTFAAVVALAALSGLGGCSGGSEEVGRIRVTKTQAVGSYELKLDGGIERLELKPDGSYSQDTIVNSKPVHSSGEWSIENRFFGPSDLILKSSDGELLLQVHDRSGKVALARNEVADWYYEPVR